MPSTFLCVASGELLIFDTNQQFATHRYPKVTYEDANENARIAPAAEPIGHFQGTQDVMHMQLRRRLSPTETRHVQYAGPDSARSRFLVCI